MTEQDKYTKHTSIMYVLLYIKALTAQQQIKGLLWHVIALSLRHCTAWRGEERGCRAKEDPGTPVQLLLFLLASYLGKLQCIMLLPGLFFCLLCALPVARKHGTESA